MKIEEFMNEIKQIENFYDKQLTDEQKQIWFKELKYIELKRFKYIEAQIYKTLKFMPKLADIIEINSNLGYSQQKLEENKIKCKKCNGTGYLTYIKKVDDGVRTLEYTFGAICSCRQQPKYEGWKISDERHRTNYYTPYIEEVIRV